MKKTLLSISLATVLILTGCASFDWKNTIPFLQPAAEVAATATLNLAVNAADRLEIANYIYSSAHALRSLSGGEVTPDTFKGVLDLWLPNQAKYADYAKYLTSIYATYYDKLSGDPKAIAEAIEQFANGIETAAGKILGK